MYLVPDLMLCSIQYKAGCYGVIGKRTGDLAGAIGVSGPGYIQVLPSPHPSLTPPIHIQDSSEIYEHLTAAISSPVYPYTVRTPYISHTRSCIYILSGKLSSRYTVLTSPFPEAFKQPPARPADYPDIRVRGTRVKEKKTTQCQLPSV